jgi:hypothetical protein
LNNFFPASLKVFNVVWFRNVTESPMRSSISMVEISYNYKKISIMIHIKIFLWLYIFDRPNSNITSWVTGIVNLRQKIMFFGCFNRKAKIIKEYFFQNFACGKLLKHCNKFKFVA